MFQSKTSIHLLKFCKTNNVVPVFHKTNLNRPCVTLVRRGILRLSKYS